MAEALPSSPGQSSKRTGSSASTAAKPRVRLVECGPLGGCGSGAPRPTGRGASAHLEWACTPAGQWVQVFSSTVIAPNRSRDKDRVEINLGLTEFGDASTEFYCARSGIPMAQGYDRIVYGDHGPYLEFSAHQLCWSAFPNFLEKPHMSYYDEYFTMDGLTMLYAQKRSVANKPNPPSGQWSAQNNRPEGYANYLIGKFYLACEADTVCVFHGGARRRKKRGGKGKGGKGQSTEDGEALDDEQDYCDGTAGYWEGSWPADQTWGYSPPWPSSAEVVVENLVENGACKQVDDSYAGSANGTSEADTAASTASPLLER
ncbi:unnamed protein product [Polarella glacialis]|uniref:Uncharacterized protein n=1 Tax=Polarella glacialis TaxID=89957 RepID=A0A813KSU0_POLGL|nr:unnamed protein product [Polarella glacialis]